ncbi:MAG: transposase [Candidatus Scalindua sp.]|jgi:REP element-mobilizing transposase RayT|nr:transposase [Candidatus Scalindua sp.]MBT5305034.1 transposase [Candidatus Scalindua sp.]MBT6230788.1 transposase [Candidatus Scalindua sp.]MBT6564785.1 transposase [Candidatus Scalindua sp.]MBT7213504.1 transposase [Candidatus Scalindua sp.]
MTRPWRIEFEGAYYHILSRGNERRDIFSDKDDRISFLDTLGKMSDRFEVEVYAYVLMDNHYHLLLKTNKPNISKSMQWFGTTYTRQYNIKHKRNGHLFQGRFKSFLIENDEYLMHLSCYIHRNPLRAGIVSRLVDYPWSSYPIYAYGKKSPEWVYTKPIHSLLDTNDKHLAYRKMVQSYSREETRIWEDFRHGLFLGSQKFVDRIKAKYLTENPDVEIPQKRRVLRDTNPETILMKAAKVLKCDTDIFLQSSRISESDKLNRDLLIYLLWSTGWYSNHEIGNLFGLGYSSISRRVTVMKSKISKDDKLNKRLTKLNSQIKV